MTGTYVPERGDIVWTTFEPRLGHEQGGARPALILTPRIYNERSSLAIACPITSRAKGYPFEVALPSGLAVSGVVLCDHMRSLDWTARGARLACRTPASVLLLVAQRTTALLT